MSTATPHTPKLLPLRIARQTVTESGVEIVDSVGTVLATCDSAEHVASRMGHARLIVQAVNSFDALREALRDSDKLVKLCATVIVNDAVANFLPYGLREQVVAYLRESAAERALALAEEGK